MPPIQPWFRPIFLTLVGLWFQASVHSADVEPLTPFGWYDLPIAKDLVCDPGNLAAVKEMESPIQVMRETNDVFKIENHFPVSDAEDCKFSWQLRNFSAPGATNAPFTVLREGVLESPSIPPGGTGELEITAARSRNADALALRVDDPDGRELWTWIWPLRRGDFYRLEEEPAEHHALPTETNGVITITAGELIATFSETTGRLLGVQRGSQNFPLANGPRLVAGGGTLRRIHFDDDGPDAFVSTKFDGDLKSIFWRVNGNGWINCDYTYLAEGTNDALGVLFDYPDERIRHLRWLGDGPSRVRNNRLRGVTLGVWEEPDTPAAHGPDDGVAPPSAGCLAGIRWLELDTADGPVTILNNQVVPYVLVAPGSRSGLGFLDTLPSFDENFKDAPAKTPSGQSDVFPGERSGSLSFYFGKLP